MAALFPTFAALALSLFAAAAAPQVVDVRMSLEGLRSEGIVALEAGDTNPDGPFHISFDFESDGDALGNPEGVGLQVDFGTYCRDRDSWVEAVLIAPSGQRWPAHRVSVPPGPDRLQDWSSGYLDDPALIKAIEAGGRFTLALQDDEGQLWNVVVIDTLAPAQRRQLFVAARAPSGDRASDAVPVAGEGLIEVVEGEPIALPSPPRPCPAP
ncbi:MAG: hypothetical protein K9G59_07470 [Caulobacter sp.]|nr:hypothetical protein [Caulobacter sp.]